MELAARWRTSDNLAYLALLALGALDAAGYCVIAPVLPAIAHQLHAGPALIGVLVASFPAGMIAGFAVAGQFVRRGRTGLVLRMSLLLTAAGALGFVFGSGLDTYFGAHSHLRDLRLSSNTTNLSKRSPGDGLP